MAIFGDIAGLKADDEMGWLVRCGVDGVLPSLTSMMLVVKLDASRNDNSLCWATESTALLQPSGTRPIDEY